MRKAMKLIPIAVLILALVGSVYGYSSGITGQSQIGCTCHGAIDSQVTVTVLGVPGNYTPGATYLLTINVTGDVPGSDGGFDLSATSGNLSTNDPNAQIVNGEATHKNNHARQWQVNWTAPNDVNATSFYVAGVVSNGSGTEGSAWNKSVYGGNIIPEFPGIAPFVVLAVVSTAVLVFARKRFSGTIARKS